LNSMMDIQVFHSSSGPGVCVFGIGLCFVSLFGYFHVVHF
jgi:hypothetical protein